MLSHPYPRIPPNLNGVKHSRTTNSVSLGLDVLDRIIDDGVPFPSIVLIEQNGSKRFGNVTQRLFIAEGLNTNQNVVVASPKRVAMEELLSSIPIEKPDVGSISSASSASAQAALRRSDAQDLKIAWRFQNTPTIDAATTSKPKFDFTKSLPRNEVNVEAVIVPSSYADLWKQLKSFLNSSTVDLDAEGPKTPLRIVIDELGSPLFADHSVNAFTSFIANLRAFVVSSCAVVLISLDTCQLNEDMVKAAEGLADVVLSFTPNSPKPEENSSSSWGGRLAVSKFPRLYGNSLFRPEVCDYDVKQTRRSLEIQRVRLDPFFSDADRPTNTEPVVNSLREMGVIAAEDDF